LTKKRIRSLKHTRGDFGDCSTPFKRKQCEREKGTPFRTKVFLGARGQEGEGGANKAGLQSWQTKNKNTEQASPSNWKRRKEKNIGE